MATWSGPYDIRRPGRVTGAMCAGRPVFSSSSGHNSVNSQDHLLFRQLQRQLEVLTSPFRQSRAARHLLRAARGTIPGSAKLAKGAPSPTVARRADFWPPAIVPPAVAGVLPASSAVEASAPACVSEWHMRRWHGQAKRFDLVDLCGTVQHRLEGRDPDTGEVVASRELAQHCGNWRVCDRCARRRKLRAREDVLRNRKVVLHVCRHQLRRSYRGSEGRWAERLLTLTVPHSGDAGEDARVLRLAWPLFQKRLLTHLARDRGAAQKPVWVRAIEVAPSEDGGHVHLHVWMVSPYVDHVWARVTWGDILEKLGVKCPPRVWNQVMHLPPLTCRYEQTSAEFRDKVKELRDTRVRVWCRTRRGPHGRDRKVLPWPHVDVRAARDQEGGAAQYATKVGVALVYTAKGTNIPASMDAFHAASVYQALEGARAIQWCRGWAPQREVRLCWRVRRLTAEEAFERGSGPDPQTLRPARSLVSSVACSKNANDAGGASTNRTTGPPFASTADMQTPATTVSSKESSVQEIERQLSLL